MFGLATLTEGSDGKMFELRNGCKRLWQDRYRYKEGEIQQKDKSTKRKAYNAKDPL